MRAARREAGAALPRELVLHHQLAGEREDEGDNGDGDGTAHAIGRDGECDVSSRAGGNIHRVIANAEARDDREAAGLRHARRVEAVGQQDQRIEILELVATNG